MSNGKMKAQVYYKPYTMKLEEIDIPKIKPDEVLVKVKACGICGSDVAYYFGKSPLETPSGEGPLVLGHEFAGEVVQMGEKAKESGLLAIGDRVIANPVQQCNACAECTRTNVNLCINKETKGVSTDGAFAEYTTMRYTHVYKISDDVSWKEAALCEPFACACYGIKKLDVKPGDSVILIGPGPIGLMQLQLIKASGAGKIIVAGIIDYGLIKSLELGADDVFNTADTFSPYYCDDFAAKVRELTDGEMANKVIVATGAKSALKSALEVSGNKSNIVFFGMPSEKTILEVPLLDVMTKDKSLLVSWQAPFTWDTALKLLKSKKVSLEDLITHEFKIEDLEEGIKLINDDSIADKLKAVVVFD